MTLALNKIAQLTGHTVRRIMSINEHLRECGVKVSHPAIIVLALLGNLVEGQSLLAQFNATTIVAQNTRNPSGAI